MQKGTSVGLMDTSVPYSCVSVSQTRVKQKVKFFIFRHLTDPQGSKNAT